LPEGSLSRRATIVAEYGQPTCDPARRDIRHAGDTFIAAANILRPYGLGPLPGVAMMVVLISRAGYITITTRYDRAAVTDGDLFARCLQAGFDEVLALGGEGRAVPASFTPDTDEPSPSSPNGSTAQ
jgi:diacylglycerol O-acyltransferase